MPLKIGIVGAENSHTIAIAKLINIEKKIPGIRVTHVWGETKQLARKASETGCIPHVVSDPSEMIGQIQGACVDHRHGKFHLPAARPLLEAKIPLFIDKPFCYRLSEGKRFLSRAAKLSTPVTSFSVLPHQDTFVQFKRDMRALGKIYSVVSTGPCDLKSKYGGIFFYGIHQVDMVINLLGIDLRHAQVIRGAKDNHVGVLTYHNGTVATMNFVGSGSSIFHLSAIGEKGRIDREILFDKNTYLAGTRTFCRMFKTGTKRETVESMLAPVAALEALEKSISRNCRVSVSNKLSVKE